MSSPLISAAELEMLENRLAYLESREEWSSKEIVKLKQDILYLTEDNVELNRKVHELVLKKCQTCANCMDMINGMKRTEEAMVVRLTKMEKEVQAFHAQAKALEENNDRRESSTFHARIKPSQKLVVGKRINLDCCYKMDKPCPSFNREGKAVFESVREGLYGIGVRMSQRGSGTLSLRVWRAESLAAIDLKTEENGGLCRGFKLVRLDKGDKVGVEVVREDGQADVNWCHFSGFLVCPF